MAYIELTDNKKITDNVELTQIKIVTAVGRGTTEEVGGWVESLDNLTNPSTGEVEGVILGDSHISGNAKIFDKAVVRDNVVIRDNAMVFGNAVVKGDARVYADGKIKDNAIVGAGCIVKAGGIIANDVEIYSCIIVEDETMTKAPFQMIGSRPEHPVALHNNMFSIGCEVHSLAVWEENIVQIGENNGYSQKEIIEYTDYLKNALKLFST